MPKPTHIGIHNICMPNHGTRNIALLRYQVQKLRSSKQPQINAVTRLFQYVLSPASTSTGLFSIENLSAKLTAPAGASVETTLQKYNFYFNWQNYCQFTKKNALQNIVWRADKSFNLMIALFL